MKTFEEIKNQLNENFNAQDSDMSFAEYVDSEAQNDPNFFRWFFGEELVEDFDSSLSDEQKETWKEFCDYIEDADDIYTVIHDLDNDDYHIVKDSDIDRYVDKCELPDYDHTSACDYSLYNTELDFAKDDMIEDGVKVFGEDFRNIEFYSEGRDEKLVVDALASDFSELSDRVEEIETFINNWESKYADYNKVDVYTYWDGSNNRAIITKEYNSDFEAGFRELSQKNAAKIIEAWDNIDEWEDEDLGYKTASNNGFIFECSQWEKDWGIVIARKN